MITSTSGPAPYASPQGGNPDHPGLQNQPSDIDATKTNPDFVDVSHHQGDVDWASYAAAGKKLAICKLTEGSDWSDEKAVENRAAASKLGLDMGLYHYAGSSGDHKFGDPVKEADFYVSQVGTLAKNEFPVLDFEDANGLKPDQLVEWAGKWCATVEEKTGKTPWIYTYAGFLHKLDATPLTHYPLWLADYNSIDRDHPPSAAPWVSLQAWQYTAGAVVPGIEGQVDASYVYGPIP